VIRRAGRQSVRSDVGPSRAGIGRKTFHGQTRPEILQLVRVDAAAEYLGIGVRTVCRYIAEGRLPAYCVGGHTIRVDQADGDAFVRRIPAGNGNTP